MTQFTTANINTINRYYINFIEDDIDNETLSTLVQQWIDETIADPELTGSAKASKVFSLKAVLKRLISDDTSDTTTVDMQTATQWHCPKCSSKIVTHIPVTGVWCVKHHGQPTTMKETK